MRQFFTRMPWTLAALFVGAGCAVTSDPPVDVHLNRSASLDGRSVAYSMHSGAQAQADPAIMLVHGWSSDRTVWDEQAVPLSEHAKVIAIDLPGHGRSDPPAGGYSMDLFADAIAAVMDDARVERAVLVGHSNGVPTVRQFYRRYPERTAGLVMVDGGLRPFFSRDSAEPFLASFAEDDYAQKVGDFIDQMPRGELTDEQRSDLREMAMRQRQEAVIGGLEASLDESIWREDRIEAPTLMLMADAPLWTEEYRQFVGAIVTDLEYRTIPEVSHFLMIDRPDTFNEALIEFYDRVSRE
jgi:pimeloyl-ACP methyl ester carboxylesterase